MLNETPIKYYESTHRTISPENTIKNIQEKLTQTGITRTSDITHLDRLKIPVYTSIRPKAEKGAVSVYAGKGPTKAHAKASSMMEAVERYSAEQQENDNTIIQKYDPKTCLNPEKLIISPHITINDEIEWVSAINIKTNEEILVPANAVYHPYNNSKVQHLFRSNTNGLASGNQLEEAIFYGLMEVIERDAWSIFEVHKTNPIQIDVTTTQNQIIRDLVEKFERENITLNLLDITSNIGIPTVLAVSDDLSLKDPALLTIGVGTHLNPEIAVIRAITEVAQSRATQIHGTREDTVRAKLARDTGYDRMKRINKHYFQEPESTIKIEDIFDKSTNNFKEDIKITLKQLKEQEINNTYYVDLTREINIPVVRVIIPQAELYAIDPTRAGKRIKPEKIIR
ncbi:MAG: YcaO-related McrA-glycine thioamidation protein [Methanobacteriaceae archaeon]|nr:YcaO-related McrA-glycine thioamidation protein [Methanobacteriaceae archaeon]